MARHTFAGLVVGLLLALGVSAAESAAEPTPTAWGEVREVDHEYANRQLVVERWPSDGRLALPTPFPHLVRCTTEGDQPKVVDFQFTPDASEMTLLLPSPADDSSRRAHSLWTLTSEKSRQLANGCIVLSALDAQVVGDTARLESHPGNHRIGFWTSADDHVAWDYKATRWGMYDVWLTYSNASPAGSEIEVRLTDAKTVEDLVAKTKLDSTGSWYRYTSAKVGRVYLSTSGEKRITVKCLNKVGPAVMNLKAVVLQPACEGKAPEQADDGIVTLHARDATVHGAMLRWEPAEKKRTLGYWVHPTDRASWSFTLHRPGTYDVQVWQGCGTGQGGSRMRIAAGEQQVDWNVEETGHFQNFRPRIVGRLNFAQGGKARLTVGPVAIARNAACDIRQIRLLPVDQ